MKTILIISAMAVAWLFMAPGCMTFRETDNDAKKKFTEKGVTLFTGIIRVNKRHIHYTKTGNDTLPTIFFVHGSPGSWNAFERYMWDKDLLQKFRMVAVDRPGFGYSNYGHALHLSSQSLCISPLFDLIKNGKPIYLVGHSLGGPMVIKLAADNPEFISAIVLLAGANDPEQEKPEKWRPVLYKTPLNLFVPGAMRPSNEELWYLKKDLYGLKDDFKKITCPVYIVHGLKDDLVPPANVDYDKKMLVNASRVNELIFPDANHFIPWSRFPQIKGLLLKLY